MKGSVTRAPIRATIALLSILALVACSAEAPQRTATAVTRTQRDGTEIVEYDGLSPEATWSLGDEPLLTIGDDEGADPPYLFSWIPAIHLRSDGALLVVEGRVPEVRIFDADGTFDHAFGGKGEGPGEFQSIWVNRLIGDTFLVWDRMARRLSTFTTDGGLIETRRVETFRDTPSDRASASGFFADGALLIAILDQPRTPGAGIMETRQSYLRWQPDGTSDELFVDINRNLYKSSDGSTRLIPLVAEQYLQPGSDAVFVTSGKALGYRRYGIDGRLEMTVRVAETPPPLDPDFLEEFKQRQIDDAPPGIAARLRIAYEEMPFPEQLPMTDGLLLDERENVWLRRYRLPRDESPQVWHVFDRHGVFLGTVHVPHRLEVKGITENRLIGVWRDELDVQSVRVLPLQRR